MKTNLKWMFITGCGAILLTIIVLNAAIVFANYQRQQRAADAAWRSANDTIATLQRELADCRGSKTGDGRSEIVPDGPATNSDLQPPHYKF